METTTFPTVMRLINVLKCLSVTVSCSGVAASCAVVGTDTRRLDCHCSSASHAIGLGKLNHSNQCKWHGVRSNARPVHLVDFLIDHTVLNADRGRALRCARTYRHMTVGRTTYHISSVSTASRPSMHGMRVPDRIVSRGRTLSSTCDKLTTITAIGCLRMIYNVSSGTLNHTIHPPFMLFSTSQTRGNSMKLKKNHVVSARDGHIFVNRIINIWNSLPDYNRHFTNGRVF